MRINTVLAIILILITMLIFFATMAMAATVSALTGQNGQFLGPLVFGIFYGYIAYRLYNCD